ncbi:MAG: MATE family efflux transporter [Tissierellia bacterium]|nr:MATE family efflux transporter [Tissierellia bacterium]
MSSLNEYGTVKDVAFYGMVFRIFNLSLTPIYGLMRALQPTVGINFGAEKYERVISSFKIFAIAALIIMLPLWLITIVFPTSIFNLMLPGKEFLQSDITNFRIFMTLAPFLPVVFMAMTFWPAIKKPKPAGIIGIARQAFLYIPLMIILPKYFGISWIYKGSFLIDISLSILIVFLISKEFKGLRQLETKK